MKMSSVRKWLSVLAAAALSAAVLTGCAAPAKQVVRSGFYFDTYVTVTDYTGSGELADELMNELSAFSVELGSAYGADANSVSGIPFDCASRTYALNSIFGNGVNITCGALTELWGIPTENPRVPSQYEIDAALKTICGFPLPVPYPDGTKLDLGAVSKGYACDRIRDFLVQRNAACDIVSLGSSTLLYGEKPDGTPFTAAVRNPDEPSAYIGTLSTPAAFISTSGGYERFFEQDGVKYEHIIDVSTGYPVETDLTTVTVLIPIDNDAGLKSDFLSTLIYIGGTKKLADYLDDSSIFVIAADKNKRVYVSGNALASFELAADSGYSYAE